MYSGLEVILDIGQYEYLPVINQAAGAVVVVHPLDQMPFPQEEGIYLTPGKSVSLGLKMVSSKMFQLKISV